MPMRTETENVSQPIELQNRIVLKKVSGHFCPVYCALNTHERCPTTAQCGNFCLLRFRPGLLRSLLSNLAHRNFQIDDHVDTKHSADARST